MKFDHAIAYRSSHRPFELAYFRAEEVEWLRNLGRLLTAIDRVRIDEQLRRYAFVTLPLPDETLRLDSGFRLCNRLEGVFAGTVLGSKSRWDDS